MLLSFGVIAGLLSDPAWSAQLSDGATQQAALAQCVSLKTTGADRILTARWLFAVMSKSPQIVDLSAVTAERTRELNQSFAGLLTRIVTKDCVNEVRPIAAGKVKDAFEQVGAALGETAMTELMSGKEVDKEVGAYADFLSEEDFKPLIDSLPNRTR